MNTPAKTLIFEEKNFRAWVETKSFANNGDTLERQFHPLLGADFPRNEEFWRHFVVPLTNRAERDKPESIIRFREGVDPVLQYISGANYSCFVHFAFAKVTMKNWNDTSLDAIYTRLASAFDVFEALVIKFHLLTCESRGVKSKLIDELPLEAFLKLAENYYKNEYPKLHQYYVTVGKKVPPITIPSTPSLFDEFFKEHPKRADYVTISGQIRAFRNAIVHDVRIGMLKNKDGSILVPKSSKVSNYRQWLRVEEAAKNHILIAQDFCQVGAQCESDIHRSVEVVNALYDVLLNQFNEDFYANDRPRLRALFGIEFRDGSPAPPAVVQQSESDSSSSFDIGVESVKSESGVYPAPRKLQE